MSTLRDAVKQMDERGESIETLSDFIDTKSTDGIIKSMGQLCLEVGQIRSAADDQIGASRAYNEAIEHLCTDTAGDAKDLLMQAQGLMFEIEAEKYKSPWKNNRSMLHYYDGVVSLYKSIRSPSKVAKYWLKKVSTGLVLAYKRWNIHLTNDQAELAANLGDRSALDTMVEIFTESVLRNDPMINQIAQMTTKMTKLIKLMIKLNVDPFTYNRIGIMNRYVRTIVQRLADDDVEQKTLARLYLATSKIDNRIAYIKDLLKATSTPQLAATECGKRCAYSLQCLWNSSHLILLGDFSFEDEIISAWLIPKLYSLGENDIVSCSSFLSRKNAVLYFTNAIQCGAIALNSKPLMRSKVAKIVRRKFIEIKMEVESQNELSTDLMRLVTGYLPWYKSAKLGKLRRRILSLTLEIQSLTYSRI